MTAWLGVDPLVYGCFGYYAGFVVCVGLCWPLLCLFLMVGADAVVWLWRLLGFVFTDTFGRRFGWVFVFGFVCRLFLGLFNNCCGLSCVICLGCLVWVECYCVEFVWLAFSCLVVFGYCITVGLCLRGLVGRLLIVVGVRFVVIGVA